jgi:hypothetical protein
MLDKHADREKEKLRKLADKADKQAILLLEKVERLRRELRILEPQLNKACIEYGKRRGMSLFREFHLRNEIERKAA